MPTGDKLFDSRRNHRNSVFIFFDFFGDTDDHGWECFGDGVKIDGSQYTP
jgi:hypothetical protein